LGNNASRGVDGDQTAGFEPVVHAMRQAIAETMCPPKQAVIARQGTRAKRVHIDRNVVFTAGIARTGNFTAGKHVIVSSREHAARTVQHRVFACTRWPDNKH
jgi:hypothetical protein